MRVAYFEFSAVVVFAEDTTSLVAEAVLWDVDDLVEPIVVGNEAGLTTVTVGSVVLDLFFVAGLEVSSSVAVVLASVVEPVRI